MRRLVFLKKKEKMGDEDRKLPNILITGTPGTGKSSHCKQLVEKVSILRHLDVNEVAKEEQLYDGFDQERGVQILDDDKVCDALEEKLKMGGGVVDTHSMIDYFPERWFDLVVCLTCNNTVLFDRLTKRGYDERKIKENVQAEIMQVIQEEARSSYDPDIVQILKSDVPEDLESNVDRIAQWVHAWIEDHK